jgi:PKD repeat protein
MRRYLSWLSGAVVAAVVTTLCVSTGTASAFDAAHDRVVSEVSDGARTPALLDGHVIDLAQVGNRIVVAGDFTQAADAPDNGGAPFAQAYVLAFDATTGRIDRNFAPQLSAEVRAIQPGPNNTVYLGGRFSMVNNQTARRVVQLSLTNGARVTRFAPPNVPGIVDDLALSGTRLFLAGTFTAIGGRQHGGLASLNATTGAVQHTYMGIDVATNHNWPGPQNPTQPPAQAPVGVENFDISPDGSRMIAIGNFKTADGLDRDQAMMIRLNATSAVVDPNWRTTGYTAACYYWAFDSYVRDVQFSPDGSYFAIAASGGGNYGTLCDTLTRWETNATGQDVQPTWAEYPGGDSLFSIAITGAAIYTGGHQRWMNNPLGRDFASSGAVPRPGISAHDPRTGVPLAWNPGRHPRGVGAEALLATSAGLYVGMDTDNIGNGFPPIPRPRLAFFPLAGGAAAPAENTGALPANVFLGGRSSPDTGGGGAGEVLFRVNAGGPELAATDGGPNWSADDGADNPLRTSGSTANSYGPVGSVDGTVPASTPAAIFTDERAASPAPNIDFGPPLRFLPTMSWFFPVAPGTTVDVRLYLANRDPATATTGSRIFSLQVEDALKLNFYDLAADVGHDVGSMKTFRTTVGLDGQLNLDFLTLQGSPIVSGIEIVESTDDGTPGPVGVDDVISRWFDGDTAMADQEVGGGGLQWSKVRGAFMADGQLYYGYPNDSGDYFLYRRSFDGVAFGPPTPLDPYNDPKWANLSTGTVWFGLIPNFYRGMVPNFYSQLATVSSMFFANGVLYYTRSGFPGLYSRGFSLDSGIVDATQRTAVASGFGDVAGAFLSGGRLWWSTASTGELRSTPWNNGAPNPANFVVEAGTDGRSWATRAMFIGPGRAPGNPNTPPVANVGSTCIALVCSFSSAGSSDLDGSIASYAWDFGDGGVSTEANPSHTFAAAGDHDVTLTVTDNEGASTSATRTVSVQTTPSTGIALRGSSGLSARAVTSVSVDIPSTVQPGDGLVLVLSTNSTVSGGTPAGWTAAGSRLSGTGPNTQVFQRVAAVGDAGRSVALTLSGQAKVTAQLLAYSGTAPTGPIASLASAAQAGSTAHATPTATAAAGSWALSVWSDKSSAARDWTPPAGVTVRSNLPGVGSGDVATLVADSGAAVSGPVGNLTARVPTADTRATTFTIVLAPNGAPPPPSAIAVRGATGRAQQGVSSTSVNIPGGVQAGDGMVLVLSTNSTVTGTPPAGWTLVSTRVAGSGTGAVTTQVFQRVAVAGDAGDPVPVALSGQARVTLQLVAYSGTSAAGPVASVTSAAFGSGTSHSTPTATAAPGDWVLSTWSDRQSAARTWAPPAGAQVRSNVPGVSGGIASLMVDSGGPVAGGTVGGLTATVPTSSVRGTVVTIVIR